MKKQKIWLAFALLAFFVVGIYFSLFYHRALPEIGIETTQSLASRDPAAIRRSYDFSALVGADFEQASKDRLIAGLKKIETNTEVGVELGQFVLKGKDGQKAFACQKYNRVLLQFSGDGSAVNGKLPAMEVDGACDIAPDANTIMPIMIPSKKILSESVGEGEFNFRDEKPVVVRFANVADSWPTTWVLTSVKLYDENTSADVIELSTEELRTRLAQPMILNFK